MTYDPMEYWRKRGKVYYKGKFDYPEIKLQELFIVEALKPLSFSSVLEAGCGFGRVTKLVLDSYSGIKQYSAFDLSPDQVDRAKQYVNNPQVNFTVSDIESFSSGSKYDLVLAAEVLLHVKPQDIRHAIYKLLSLSSRYLVHIDWCEDNLVEKSAPHNFMHDYDGIYEELGLHHTKTMIRAKKMLKSVDARQAIFVVNVA
jgi:trans-aconitate methyltransferase